MKVQQAIFKFRGWQFTWHPTGTKKIHGRKNTVWEVVIEHTARPKFKTIWTIIAFVPSAFLCRRLKKRLLLKDISK
jgi:hypothetical protein